jgi:hypothetical protein
MDTIDNPPIVLAIAFPTSASEMISMGAPAAGSLDVQIDISDLSVALLP